jgi:SAM-dependent methyltransferase
MNTLITRPRRVRRAASAERVREDNKLRTEDRSAHDWYRFVLSYPAHLVREYLERFGMTERNRVLDPFCGTGTTVVECKKLGIPSVGLEANPMAAFAARVKVDWAPSPAGLERHAREIADSAAAKLRAQGIPDSAGETPITRKRPQLRGLPPDAERLLLANSISPLPLHRTLVLLDAIRGRGRSPYLRHELLALAKAVVFDVSNLHFGPEVGVGPPREDAAVVSAWLGEVLEIADDLRTLRAQRGTEADVRVADSRQVRAELPPESIDAVITSPPYPNEKDYTRATRLESVLLGFLHNKEELRALKRSLVRSNTRGVYQGDDDHLLVAEHQEIERIAAAIESRRIELGKTSGFERLYPRVTRLYFGGMARHLKELQAVLRPGARLAYVVGDQASYLRVMIRTGELLGDIARSLGYEEIDRRLFRTRLATATREQLREEVVVLRWPGSARRTRGRRNGQGS